MKTYLVGGAVRDALLGRPVTERDYVVVGSSPEAMVEQGFKPVGKDFPVFLHPSSKEEYALARTERKTATGYHGFDFYTGADVSLEDDLIRRDLTVNAIAQDADGTLVDPYNGVADLENRILRHVSPAFAEDPVRILRIARFAARYAPLGFTIADATMALMKSMVTAGEVDALVPERVWQELKRSLMESRPRVFFEVLRACGALERLIPELDQQFGVPQPAKYHPEIDCGEHTLMVLEQAAKLQGSLEIRFACLCHDFGKGITPADILPSHRGHESTGVPLVKAFCERLRVPKACSELALMVTRYHLGTHIALEVKASTLVDWFQALDAYRRPERFYDFLLACEADARGRKGLEDRDYPQRDYLLNTFAACRDVDVQSLLNQGHKGPKLAEAIRRTRIKAVTSSHAFKHRKQTL